MNHLEHLKTKQSQYLKGMTISLVLAIVGFITAEQFVGHQAAIYMVSGMGGFFSSLYFLACICTFPTLKNTVPSFAQGQQIMKKDFLEFPEALTYLQVVKVGKDAYLLKDSQGNLSEIWISDQSEYKASEVA